MWCGGGGCWGSLVPFPLCTCRLNLCDSALCNGMRLCRWDTTCCSSDFGAVSPTAATCHEEKYNSQVWLICVCVYLFIFVFLCIFYEKNKNVSAFVSLNSAPESHHGIVNTDWWPWCNDTNSMEEIPSWDANSDSASQEVPAFCGTWQFITAFTTTCHWSLSWVRWILSTLFQPFALRSILILYSPSMPRSS
jgi:hypothetical protein